MSGVEGASESLTPMDVGDFAEDPAILAFQRAKSVVENNSPPKITMSSTPTGICFHPEEELLAVATFNAEINIFSYTNRKNELQNGVKHQNYCRELKFNLDGKKLYTTMNDKYLLIYDTAFMQLERAVNGASKGFPSSLFVVDENIITIGDDNGVVNLWDKRCQSRAMKFEVASDVITSMLCDPNYRTLVSTSADGTISTIKIRGGKIASKSDVYPHSLNCSSLMKHSSKLAVGDSDGRLIVFNWGEFYSHCDIFTNKGGGINRSLPITEHIVITGLDNGTIKATHLFPNEVIGQIGDHNKSPVEELDICNDGHLIATTSIDKDILFWNIDFLSDFILPSKKGKHNKQKESKRLLPSSKGQNSVHFFDDLVD